jgi:hypothetical protein
MKPFLRKNPYIGINAHHNSWLQAKHQWGGFHTAYITRIHDALVELVYPLGYNVEMENSLQIRRLGDSPLSPKADVIIFDTQPSRYSQPIVNSPLQEAIPLLEFAGYDPDDLYFPALSIKKQDDLEPVVWIEILSPSNKLPYSNFKSYDSKRQTLLITGIVYVEIDFIHEQPPTWSRIADYSHGYTQAYPYRIIVIDSRPNFHSGKVKLSEFAVNMPIPTMPIPLNDDDLIQVNFNAPYQATFEESSFGRYVDYAQPPLNFESYTAVDREAILQLMQSLPTE